MRVSRLVPARIRNEERGAVLMIVAICLLIFLGMLVLTVDLGRGVAFKREVVSGTDAAALAAAQQCALEQGSVEAEAAAMEVLDQNVDLTIASVSIEMPECDQPQGSELKTVTVTTTADIDYFFAPIFGIGSGDIAARAVAVWAPAASANPVPISVDLQQLLDCGIIPSDPPPPDAPIECELEYPKDSLQEPRWGVLDLSQWGDPDAAPCKVDAAELQQIIANGGYWEGVELNGEPPGSEPTMTCVDNGFEFSVWDTMEGHTLIFPVVDIPTSTGTVKPNRPPLGGRDCTGADIESLKAQKYNCQLDTLDVVGWIVLRVTSVDQNGATVTFDSTSSLTTSGGIPSNAIDLGVRAVRLVE